MPDYEVVWNGGALLPGGSRPSSLAPACQGPSRLDNRYAYDCYALAQKARTTAQRKHWYTHTRPLDPTAASPGGPIPKGVTPMRRNLTPKQRFAVVGLTDGVVDDVVLFTSRDSATHYADQLRPHFDCVYVRVVRHAQAVLAQAKVR